MSNATLRTLVEDVRTRRSTRRQMVKRATALGFSLPAIGASLRTLSASAQEATTVTFWTAHTDLGLSVYQGIVDTYNGTAEGHQVELVQIPPAEVTDVTKLMTAVRGGTGPDVYHLDRFIVAQRAADGLLQDITSQVEDMADNYLPFARAEASFNGQMYALPLTTDARALFYNRAMLTEAGIDPEEFAPAAGPLTWTRVAEIAANFDVKDSSGNFTRMGFVPWASQGHAYTWGFSYGGTFFDEAACAVTPDDPKIVEAFQWVYDYCAALGPQQVSAFGSPSMERGFPPQEHPFIQGRLAMQITGNWVTKHMEIYAPDADYGITYI
ncbi:MAG: extracellular solute-binding protein, partial [Dehalococcoidia bacterium]